MGKLVVCIDTGGLTDLQLNKVYEVIEETTERVFGMTQHFYVVQTEEGLRKYFKFRFVDQPRTFNNAGLEDIQEKAMKFLDMLEERDK